MDNSKVEDLVKFKGYLGAVLFPKKPKVLGKGADTYGITRWYVSEVIQGDICINKNGEVAVVGEFPDSVKIGVPYIILGKRKNHDVYGTQYEIVYIQEQVELKSYKAQHAFLSSFLTEKQVTDFFKLYENPIEIIKNHEIDKLVKVYNVGQVRAQQIIDHYERCKDNSQVYIDLMDYGLTPAFLQRLISTYKSPQLAVKMVKEKPYKLYYDMDGVGFRTADTIALKGGFDPKSVERVKAYIVYYLEDKAYEQGDSYVTAGELLLGVYDYFGGKEEITADVLNEKGEIIGNNISLAIEQLIKEEIIFLEDNENKARRRVGLIKIRQLEQEIAFHLKRLISAPNRFNYNNWEENVKRLEKHQGFPFAKEQLDGIKLGLDSQVCLISGLAGSGKSSLVSGILASLPHYTFAQCALSGKAAARLQEVTGEEGSTIHRLLMSNMDMETGKCQLPFDIIILDEISLVGGEIFLQLIKAIPDGCKLIMLGDLGQLESIGALNLAADLFNSVNIPTVELKEIHRQAAMSGIITTAHSVRNQEQLFESPNHTGEEVLGELHDMVLDMNSTRENIRTKVGRWFCKYFESDLVNKDIMKIQVIAPVKERGDACVHNLNLDIQNYYNPVNEEDANEPRLKMGTTKDGIYYIHKGDKVMCIKNNYQTTTPEGMTCPIFNGWTGIVKYIGENMIMVHFPLAKEDVMLDYKTAHSHLILGYASTVHKMQGSDYPVVIGAIDFTTPPKMLTNSLLYTLITRAKKMCVIVTETRAFNQAIATNFVSTKRTFLQEFLEDNKK